MEVSGVVAAIADKGMPTLIITSADDDRSLCLQFGGDDGIETVGRVHHLLNALVVGIITEIVFESTGYIRSICSG